MASDMVSERKSSDDDLFTQIATVANPQYRNTFTLAVGPVPAALRIPMVTWKPRDGFNEKFVEFELNLENLYNVHGAPSFIASVPPLVTSPVKRTKEADARAVAEAKALAQYQAINTSIYWHVVPNIDISGPARIRDLRKIQSFVCGPLADGKALIEWALGFASLASMDKQAELFITLRCRLIWHQENNLSLMIVHSQSWTYTSTWRHSMLSTRTRCISSTTTRNCCRLR